MEQRVVSGDRSMVMPERKLNEPFQKLQEKGSTGIQVESSARTLKNEEETESLISEEHCTSLLSASTSLPDTQEKAGNEQNENHGQACQQSVNNCSFEQSSLRHQAHAQGGHQPRLFAAAPRADQLIGISPVRERTTRPPDSDIDVRRRMAVCEVTDDAQNKRTKMRVFMKRF